ncbi:MAG: class I SAM-dependent methyltransferase [Desulfurococcales archaeon]|nr:class I SAM-dependent methyltransferase [Desulfurococcales archaeon]
MSSREELWSEVVASIEDLALHGCYEKVNRYMSFNTVNKLRVKTIRLLGDSKRVLDAGCGPGTSSILIAKMKPHTMLYLLDPSLKMLNIAVKTLTKSVNSVDVRPLVGRFERIPLRDNEVDGITAMFSFRDALDFEEAVAEFARVLGENGKLAILDIYRPRRLGRILVELYFRIIVPIAVMLSRCATRITKYTDFLETINVMLTKEELEDLLSKYFEKTVTYNIAPGLAIFYAESPKI